MALAGEHVGRGGGAEQAFPSRGYAAVSESGFLMSLCPLSLNLCPGYGGVEFSFKSGLVRRECECWCDRWDGGGP